MEKQIGRERRERKMENKIKEIKRQNIFVSRAKRLITTEYIQYIARVEILDNN